MTINDSNWQFLHDATGLSLPFNDMYFRYLRDQGYTGTLQDMIAASGLGMNPSGFANPSQSMRGLDLFNASGSSTRKVIVSNGASLIWVCSRDDNGQGYIAQKIEKNNVLAGADDLGGAQEVWRRTRVWVVKEAFILNNTATTTTGTWTDANLNSTTNPYGMGADSTLRSVPSSHTTSSGALKEYTVWVDANGQFTILIQDRTGLSPVGAPSVVVSDATTSEAISTFAADVGVAGLRQVVLTHPTKRSTSFVCRVSHGGGSGRLTIIGVNSVTITKPSDPMPSGVTYNFDTFLRLATDTPFCNHDGAQDYAFRDQAAAKTGGSVHGGETSVSLTTMLDDVAYTFPNRGAGTKFIIRQSSLIDYTAFGGGTITVDSVKDFTIDGRPRQTFSASGTAVLSTAYLGMSTPAITFKEILRPVAVADGSAGTGDGDTVDDYLMGNIDAQVLYEDNVSGDQILTESSAVFMYPGFEQVVAHWDPLYYFKRWNFAIKDNNRPLGDAKWKTADSYRIVA